MSKAVVDECRDGRRASTGERPSGRVVILGGGSTGEAFAATLRRLDKEVPITLVEKELLGGECSYWACMPSKALLRPAELIHAASIAPGAAEAITGKLDVDRVFWWRDQVTDGLDDKAQANWITDLGVDLVRGKGRIVRPGIVDVGGREIAYEHLAVATGSDAAVPTIDGLTDVPFWTNREATQTDEIPESLVVLGGGVVGAELGQFFNRLGSKVTIVELFSHLLSQQDPAAGHLLQELLEEEGIAVKVNTETTRVQYTDGTFRLFSDDEPIAEAERLLVATGRRPNSDGLGLEQVDVEITPKGIRVDDRMRAGDGVWAIGDVNGIALFTHAGKYQARIAAENIAGLDVRADHRAVPAVAFTDPQVASVGTTKGDGLVTSTWKVNATARASTYERPKRPGFLKLAADPQRRVLVGATAVGPESAEWIGQVTLAIKAEVPIEVLCDTIQPYPTFAEAIYFAARDLPIEQLESARRRPGHDNLGASP